MENTGTIKKNLFYLILISFIVHQMIVFWADYSIIHTFKIVNAILVCAYMFLAFKDTKGLQKKIYFLVFCSALILFVGGDLLYLLLLNVDYFLRADLYVLVDILDSMLFINMVLVCFSIIKKEWDNIEKMQIFLDFLPLLICSFFMIKGFVRVFFPNFDVSLKDMYLIAISVILALLLLTLVTMISSKRHDRRFLYSMIVVVLAYISIAVIDTIYTYQATSSYHKNVRFLDFLYIIPMFMIFVSGNDYFVKEEKNKNQYFDKKDLIRTKSYIISSMFILIIGLNIALYKNQFLSDKEILTVVGSILAYFFMVLNYNAMIENKNLLSSQMKINYELEKRVYERTKELEEKNKEFLNIINTDSLTLLGSRNFLSDILEDYDVEKGNNISIFIVDIIRFKNINNISGHKVGDLVLKEVAKRLKSIFKDEKVFRTDSNEFAILIENSNKTSQELNDIAQKITNVLTSMMDIKSHAINLNISIGCASYTNEKSYIELLRNAEYASKEAKTDYKVFGNYRYYDSQMAKKITRKNMIDALLQTIDYDEEFSLYFQPQFDIDGTNLLGMESLIRWKSPSLGFVSPGEFIPIAEESNAIIKIVHWTIEKACRQIKKWNAYYNKDYKVAVNISPEYLENYDFLTEVLYYVNDEKIKASWLDFEITEMTVMQVGETVFSLFKALHELGVSISIDDFGTGYSSLSYIKNFKIDKIKIAKELIDNIKTDKNEYMIVNAIIMMSNGLGIETIAEGVETEQQKDILKEIGCDQIQGYYYGRPVPAEDFEKMYILNF